VYFGRVLIKFYTYSNNSQGLQFIENSAYSALKYSCSLKNSHLLSVKFS